MVSLRGRGDLKESFRKEALPHLDALYRFALHRYRDSDMAQDLVQETYKEAWSSFSTYRSGSNCKAWLFRIFFRVASRMHRQETERRQLDLEQAPSGLLSVSGPHRRFEDKEIILSILEALPERYRSILILADAEEMSYREISDLLGIPLGTVMSRLNRGRALFREKFLRQAGDLGVETA